MALVVHAYGAYASYTTPGWRDGDYQMRALVKALKGEAFKGYANIVGLDGVTRRIDANSGQAALTTFSLWAAQRLTDLKTGSVTLVPVPSSSQVTFEQDTCPIRMARAVAQRYASANIGPWLRFNEPMQAAHAGGGSRNQAVLEEALEVAGSGVVKSRPAVLVDDVKTTGAHLKACATVLRAQGVTVECVLVAGSTVWHQHPTPLDLEPEDLEASPFDDFEF